MGTKLREYETYFVLSPELTEDATNKVIERLKAVLDRMGASLMREDNWGSRKLSYMVQKQLRGTYRMFHYAGPPNTVEELERTLRNQEQVIRFTTSVHGTIADVEARRAEILKLASEKEAARQEAERRVAEKAAAAQAAAAEAAAPEAAPEAQS